MKKTDCKINIVVYKWSDQIFRNHMPKQPELGGAVIWQCYGRCI